MSSHLLKTLPYEDGFVMPAEFEPQSAVWLLVGGAYSHWHNGGFKIRETQVNLAKAINAAGTHVNIGVPNDLYLETEYIFAGLDVSIYEMSLDNCWPRDSGAIYVKNRKTGEVRGVDFKFNAWGGDSNGAMISYANDDLAARKMLQATGHDRYKTTFVLEGGSIIADGEGTVITTESCLLNPNRNPGLTRQQIEEKLKTYLGFEKVIWLNEGIDLNAGETDGHVDDICSFIGPAEVVCCYTEDPTNEYYKVFKNCYEILCNSTDAKGRKLKVHKLTMPKVPTYMSQEEVDAIDVVEGTLPRTTDDYAIASYMNFLIVNGAIIFPQYGDEYDELAREQVSQGVGQNPDGKWRKEGDFAVPSYANFLITNGSIIFPIYGLDTDEEAVKCLEEIVAGRYVVRPVNAHEIALCGGSIHCFTQQVVK